MFQSLVFSRKTFSALFNCFGGQKFKLSDEIKTPEDSIYCLSDTWYFWLHSVYDWKPAFTQDFAVRVLTFSNLS